jgi:hypothetical protein
MYKRYQDVLDLVAMIDTTKGADNHLIVNEICEYFHQNFADPTIMYANIHSDTFKRLCSDVKDILMHPCSLRFASMVKAIPPEFAALVWPVAVMRYILRDLNVNVNPNKIGGFRLFFNMYGRIILSA